MASHFNATARVLAHGYVLVDPALRVEVHDEELLEETAPRMGRWQVFKAHWLSVAGLLVVAASVFAVMRHQLSPRGDSDEFRLAAVHVPAGPLHQLADVEEQVNTANPVWVPHFLDGHPLAVCNDGTPAAYYYRAGVVSRRTWLVWLEGAGWCWDVESCARPWHVRLGTSRHFPRLPEDVANWAKTLEGIFDENEQSPFQDVNVAYVRTCSNDAFMGDRPPETDDHVPGRSWNFRGKAIIDGVFADLTHRYGLGKMLIDRVIYGGCSSGARGAMTTLDYVASELVGNATVRGLMDSPVWLPLEPLKPGVVSFDDQAKDFLDFANASGVLDEHCVSRYPGHAKWKCLEGAFRLPFLRTPYFLTQSQYDLFGISVNVFGRFAPFVPLNDKQREYAETYRHSLVEYLPTPLPGSGQTIYSTACYTHCSLTSHTFYKIQASGVGVFHLLQHWVITSGAEESTGYLVDRCEGFNCGQLPMVSTTKASTGKSGESDKAKWNVPGLGWLR